MSNDSPKKIETEITLVKSNPPRAWQPFTPHGVAAFAQAPLARTLFLQMITAFLAAAVMIWFLNTNFVPSISGAIEFIPDEAALVNGELTNVSSGVLSQQKFLSFVIDLEHTGETGQTADLQVELRKDYFQICSLLGCGLFVYPSQNIPIGRSTAEPWWGARQPVILATCGALAFVQVCSSWILLALIYAPIAKIIAYFSDRELSWRGSWRLASIAQIPGALLMSLAIFLYGVQAFDLIRFLFFFAAHFVVAWVYLGAASCFLPRVSEKIPAATNPFSHR